MKGWQKRVMSEKTGVDENLKRLNDFMETDRFWELPNVDQSLLRHQATVMQDYSETLRKRIERFNQDT